jgi:hypothetical protein
LADQQRGVDVQAQPPHPLGLILPTGLLGGDRGGDRWRRAAGLPHPLAGGPHRGGQLLDNQLTLGQGGDGAVGGGRRGDLAEQLRLALERFHVAQRVTAIARVNTRSRTTLPGSCLRQGRQRPILRRR